MVRRASRINASSMKLGVRAHRAARRDAAERNTEQINRR